MPDHCQFHLTLTAKQNKVIWERYQTVYSKVKGSVAAPTAGLHFTDKVFEQLKADGHELAELTLHVGAGTFQPVKSETISGHEMHSEHLYISRNFLNKLMHHSGKKNCGWHHFCQNFGKLVLAGDFKHYKNPEISIENLKVSQWEAYQGNDQIVSTKRSTGGSCKLAGSTSNRLSVGINSNHHSSGISVSDC